MLCDQASDAINSEIITNHASPATRHSYSSNIQSGGCQYPGLRSTLSTTPNGSRVPTLPYPTRDCVSV